MNIKRLIQKSSLELKDSGIPTFDLDARILLKEAIKQDNTFVFTHPDFLITNAQYSKFRRLIRRRKAGEPVAYILGKKEFCGLDFKVNKNVLIPRPETEWLVEQAIDYIKNLESGIWNLANKESYNILDIGTGSGCIIICLAEEIEKQFSNSAIQQFNLFATDNSERAIAVAKRNSKIHQAENVHFYLSDLFSNKQLPKKFDVIIANLPYVPRSAKNISIDFEPKEAIFAADNGMAIIKRFLIDAKNRITANGLILVEADCRNVKQIFDFTKKHYPNSKIELKQDLASLDRYVSIKK